MGLSQEQLGVSVSTNIHNLVIALPGSGKTFTMISFIGNVVTDPDTNLIALTFTNAAAQEMKSRVGKSIKGRKRKQVYISTFHSVLMQMIKRYPELVSKEILMGPSERSYNYFIFKQMTDVHSLGREPVTEGVKPFKSNEKKYMYSMVTRIVKSRILKLDSKLCTESERFQSVMGFDYFTYYVKKIEELNVWSLDFMCFDVTRRLVAGEIEPFICSHMVVDEYQDTDAIQYEWIKAHANKGTLLTVVGDDDQAIYSFRNSLGVKGIEKFRQDFQHAYHTLSMCYRCPPEILYAAENVVLNNSARIDKEMKTLDGAAGNLYLVPTQDERDEMSYIITGMRKHHLDSRAILTRTNKQLDEIECYLKIHEIPYKRLNGTSIWQNENLIFWAHLLFTIIEPSKSTYLKRVLVTFDEDQETIFDILKKSNGLGFCHVEDEMLWSQTTNTLYFMCRTYGNFCNEQNAVKIAEMIDYVGQSFTSVLTKQQNEFLDIFKNLVNGVKGDLGQRIDYMIEWSMRRDTKELDDNVVILNSFHGSKGLEWDVVWLAGVNEDKLPMQMKNIKPDEINYEEERRLLFVAMTRAKCDLYLSWFTPAAPSQFLLEAFPDEMGPLVKSTHVEEKQGGLQTEK